MVAQEELTNDVTFLGHRDDVIKILGTCDVLACASREEGFGLAILEAMACGVPVIATRCGGPENIIEHEKNGLLVPPADPWQLALALHRIYSDPILALHLVAEARTTYIDRFTAAHSAASFLKMVNALTTI